MKKVKITILKTTFQEDLAKEYGIPVVVTEHSGGIISKTISKERLLLRAWKAVKRITGIRKSLLTLFMECPRRIPVS